MAVKSSANSNCERAPDLTKYAAIRRDVHTSGFAVIPGFLNVEEVEDLRQECQSILEAARRRDMDSIDANHQWIVQRGCIFQTIPSVLEPWLSTGLHAFAAVRSHRPCTSKACQTLLSSKMLTLVVALLGKSACLFNDQYIVKPPNCGAASAFAWHCDKDWIPAEDARDTVYVSVWIALDDVTEENGPLLVQRISRVKDTSQDCQPLATQPEVLTVPSGSAVIMTSDLQHCSLANNGSCLRRAYMPQFSAKPMRDQSGQPLALAVPILTLDS